MRPPTEAASSLWRGFSFDLDFLEHLLKCFDLVPRFFVSRCLLCVFQCVDLGLLADSSAARHRIELVVRESACFNFLGIHDRLLLVRRSDHPLVPCAWRVGSGSADYRDPGHGSKQATPKIKLGHQGSKQASTGPPKRTYCEPRTNSVRYSLITGPPSVCPTSESPP